MAVLILYYLLGMMGGGDVKLMGAVGALLGPADAFYAFVFSAIVGGIYAIYKLIVEALFGNIENTFFYRYGVMAKTFLYTRQFAYIRAAETEKKVRLCYGVAISLGTLSFVLWKHGGYYNWLGFLPG
jgi:prepilin peptidase CpaA